MTPDKLQERVASGAVSARQLVLAGPGTGKTETVAKRLVYLLQHGTKPAEILVLSFSRSAVRTLMRRIEKTSNALGGVLDDLRHISIRTFDSWTFRILRQLGHTPKDLLRKKHDQNISLLTGIIASKQSEELQTLLGGIRHIVVDEFQDLSGVRGELVLRLLELLAPAGKNGTGFTILGDEAQAIYGFSLRNLEDSDRNGLTSKELIEKIRNNYKTELTSTELTTNYRAVPNLAKLAIHLRQILSRETSGQIKLNSMRKLFGSIPEQDLEITSVLTSGLSDNTAAILTRTNGEAIRVYQKIMGSSCHPPSVSVVLDAGTQSNYVPAWVGATLGRVQGTTVTGSQFHDIYKCLYTGSGAELANKLEIPAEDIAWNRLIRAADSGAGSSHINLEQLRNRLDWPDLFPDDESIPSGTIHITTIHQSKGREFGKVSLVESDVEHREPVLDAQALEEASVIFVGVTRAGELLTRIPVGQIYPLSSWSFDGEAQKRWGMWRNGWINMEMGLPGDISNSSFIDVKVHESESKVNELQDFLACNAADLRGRKVMLTKMELPGKEGHFVYGIHLQEGREPKELLGLTSERLTYDLLHQLGKKYYLPSVIMNLRITDVITMCLHGEDTTTLAKNWAKSGLWLGVKIYGTGDFKVKAK